MIQFNFYRKKILYIVLLSFVFGCSSHQNTNEKIISNWQILYQNTKSIKSIQNNNRWHSFLMPKMFKLPYKPKKAYQYVWLKGEFNLSKDETAKFYGISLGRVYFVDKTFLNNKKIGSYLPAEFSMVHYPRNYKIPPKILKEGKNYLLINLGAYGKEYGGFVTLPKLLTRKNFIFQKKIDAFIYQSLPIGIVVFLLGQIIFNIIFFLRRRKKLVNLYSAIICFTWVIYIAVIFSPFSFLGNNLRTSILWAMTSFVPIFFLLLIESFYKIYLTTLNKIFIPFFAILSLSLILFHDTTSAYYPGRVVGIIALFSAMSVLVFTIIKVNSYKPDKNFYVFIFLGLFPGIFIVWDIINYLWVFHYPPLSHTYTLPLFVIGMVVLILNEVIKTEIELEILYDKLKEKNHPNTKPVITSSTETKLERVIKFLKENYRSDISREGLSNAMGMSPDHMSRMFKAYSGKKINEFINELRIKESAKLLEESNKKIIDIAFFVGFESLATFNRIFLKTLEKTPSQYRKEKKI